MFSYHTFTIDVFLPYAYDLFLLPGRSHLMFSYHMLTIDVFLPYVYDRCVPTGCSVTTCSFFAQMTQCRVAPSDDSVSSGTI